MQKRTLINEFDVVVNGEVRRVRRVQVETFVEVKEAVVKTLNLCMITYMGKDLHEEWLTHEQQVDLIKEHKSKDYYYLGEDKEIIIGYKTSTVLDNVVIEEEDITDEYNNYLDELF